MPKMERCLLAETRSGLLIEIKELKTALDCLFKKGDLEATWHQQGSYNSQEVDGFSLYYDLDHRAYPKRGYRYYIPKVGVFRNLEHIQNYFRHYSKDPLIWITDGERNLAINLTVAAIEALRRKA